MYRKRHGRQHRSSVLKQGSRRGYYEEVRRQLITLVVSEWLINDSAARPNNDDVRSERSAFLPCHQVSRHPRVFRILPSVPWGPVKKYNTVWLTIRLSAIDSNGSSRVPMNFDRSCVNFAFLSFSLDYSCH